MGFIKFLGTAGARFVMIRQLRFSAGIWINYKSTNIIIDPGPGSLLRCNLSKPKLDPSSLDGIILTHKHLDHCGDINVMIEAMTEGGFKKRGVVFLPSDAVGDDGVIFKYLMNFPEKFVFLKESDQFLIGDIKFTTPLRNKHPVETYGLKFYFENNIVSFISDTDYFDKIIEIYKDSDTIILNVVFYQNRDDIEHLSLDEALKIAEKIKPKKTILTHFGMSILKAKPYVLEEKIKKNLKIDIKFAYDGFNLDI